jgi:uncharacterized protein YbjT (DUF2867 family)
VLSRRPGVGTHEGDLTTGEGVAEAAAGAELVLHAASDARRLGNDDVVQTRRLLDAARDARHLLYVSIVGIDRIPYRYYRNKLACEREIERAGVPHTIFRATQFHQLLRSMLARVERLPVAPLPLAWRFQSVAAAEAAERAVELLEGEPQGRAPDFGGPQVLDVREIVDVWRARRGRPHRVVSVWWPGRVYRGFRDALNTTPNAGGRQTWAEYVESLG